MRAFTLVELMISVLILGVGLTSVANSYILALRGADSVQNNISALVIAKEKFEDLELASLKTAVVSSSSSEVIKSSTKNYTYQQEITQTEESADAPKYPVLACLSVNWTERNSPKNVTLSTYLLQKK